MVRTKRMASVAAVFGLAAVGVMAMPHNANAWWRRSVWIGGPVYVAPPPVYYAPPVVYAAPPMVAYYAPRRVWIGPHWYGGYWVRGHWR